MGSHQLLEKCTVYHLLARFVPYTVPDTVPPLLDWLATVPASESQLAEIHLGQLVTMRDLDQQEEANRQLEMYGDQIREIPMENRWQSLLGNGLNE